MGKSAEVSLGLEHPAGHLKLPLRAGEAPAQLRVLRQEGVRRLSPPEPRGSLKSVLVPLMPPGGEVRGVEAFAAQKGTDIAWAGQLFRFAQDAQLVFGGEPAPVCALYELRVRNYWGGVCGRPQAPLAYGSPGLRVSGAVPFGTLCNTDIYVLRSRPTCSVIPWS